jgi:Ser/Thr protein kinase RdoA (MazF antagonist)
MGQRRHPNQRALLSLPVELRRTTVPVQVRAWIQRVTGSVVERVTRLRGASSAAIHRLDLADGSRLVLRRYVWRHYVVSEPEAPGREADAMRFAHRHGLRVPELVAADASGGDVGDGVPVLLMTYVPGHPIAVPDLRALAETAAAIHDVDAHDLGHEYFPWYEAEMTTPPPLTRHPELWERAIDVWRTSLPAYRPTFIHRDFHPGNLLWSRRRLTGIVDWAASCRGPVGCDIAHCRGNLRDLAGPATADEFVSVYVSTTGFTLDPFWVMAGHLENDHDHWTVERLALDEPDLFAAFRAIAN